MIRYLERKDKENWIKLYCGYAKFYKVPMNQDILDNLHNKQLHLSLYPRNILWF